MSYSPARSNRLTILMAIYNGALNLGQQLESLDQQEFQSWDLTASDDGSTDASRAIIERFARSVTKHGHKVDLRAGPGNGFAENFLDMIANLPEDCGRVALSDQDDVWLPDKLSRAIAHLDKVPSDQPALYCSRRYIWLPGKKAGRTISRNYRHAPGFTNALIENIAPGNTIVLNAAAARIARVAAQQRPESIFAHDWWLYLVVSGVGGIVLFDPSPTLLYRQHDTNILGAGERPGTMLANKRDVLKGVFAKRIAGNIKALETITPMLTQENRARLALFAQARRAPLFQRLTLLRQAGVYRQGRLSNISFWGAACFGLT